MPISTGYKYRTPLKSDYLNSIMSSVSRPGLLRRPALPITAINNNQGTLLIGAFDAFIVPANAYESSVVSQTTDAYGRNNAGMLVKVTFSQKSKVEVGFNTAAIAIQYSNLKGDSGTVDTKDAQIVALSYSDLKNISDYTSPWTASGTQTVTTATKEKTTTVIIATCFLRKTGDDSGYLICNTNGAMLSPLLLNSEGWVGNTYISLQSPFEDIFTSSSSSSVFSNYLRLNSMMTGRAINPSGGLAAFLNGRNGITQLKNSNTSINLNILTANGDSAYFNNLGAFSYDSGKSNAYRYHLIALDTTSTSSLLRISNSTNDLSSLQPKDIPSSVIAVVELLVSETWTEGTYPTSASGTVTKDKFAGFRIFPVVQEPSRAVYSGNTLYIN